MATPKIVATSKIRDGYYVLHVTTEAGPLAFGDVSPEHMQAAISECDAAGVTPIVILEATPAEPAPE